VPRTTESEGDFEEEDDYSAPEDFEYHPVADDPGVFWCPKCGAEMYGDASLCSKCGDYVKPGARPRAAAPWWIWVGLVLIVLLMLGGLVASILR
jgi:predicted nucleic acid-binding Zn ribbon protein